LAFHEFVETIIAKRPSLHESETMDDTNQATHVEAKLHILNLQRYFTQQGFNDEGHYCWINVLI